MVKLCCIRGHSYESAPRNQHWPHMLSSVLHSGATVFLTALRNQHWPLVQSFHLCCCAAPGATVSTPLPQRAPTHTVAKPAAVLHRRAQYHPAPPWSTEEETHCHEKIHHHGGGGWGGRGERRGEGGHNVKLMNVRGGCILVNSIAVKPSNNPSFGYF